MKFKGLAAKKGAKKLLLAAALVSSTAMAQDLSIATYTDVSGFDPHDTSSTPSLSIQSGMFECLFQFDQDMKVIPVLGTDYKQNDTATQFTITLRQGVSFQDGQPFNAEAAKANLDRLANQENKLKRNSLFRLINDVKVVDEYTVEINLSEAVRCHDQHSGSPICGDVESKIPG